MLTTPPRPVIDEYFGTKVTDDFRWLEDWSDPAVKAWSDSQNAHARKVLDALPGVAAVRERVTQLRGAGIVGYRFLSCRGGRCFALKSQPPRQQPLLVTFTDPDRPAEERPVIDPLLLDPTGHTSIDWYVASPDGKLVAASLSEAGSERGSIYVIDVAAGGRVGEIVPRVNYGTAGGSLAWAADSSGFYYTRYPHEGERPPEDLDFYVQIYFHALGAPARDDRYEVGKEFPRIGEPKVRVSPDGQTVLVNVQNGDGGEFLQVVKRPASGWTQLTTFQDCIVGGFFTRDNSLLLLSRRDAPRGKILRLPLPPGRAPSLADAEALIPERADAVIEFDFFDPDSVVATATRISIVDQWGGLNQVSQFSLDGRHIGTVALPLVSSVPEIVDVDDDSLFMRVTGYLEPDAWYELGTGSASGPAGLRRLAISSTSPADFSDVEVVRELATSKDGARVPLNIIKRKETSLNGANPTVLTGYGGYGVSQRPGFQAINKVWLEQGGIMVVANIRGGSEFGEEWHEAGRLTSKQNVFDDFIAAAEYLIARGYTSTRHLGIRGGSNGGLLVGAALTQRPDLFRAVIGQVGIYDMLRVELSSNGAFNVPEFGSVRNAEQFQAMFSYSPYHRVRSGTSYPSVLLLTGANDPRVDPMHSRKMTAQLQQATGQPGEALLRTSAASGHGLGTALSEIIEQDVDIYSFLLAKLR